ncbi:MAG: hypothetical protein PHD95_03355 [Candidatus ainarchaeum sp.]|nr:hypothetical protein [Candidatus ainarchaeum sp.]
MGKKIIAIGFLFLLAFAWVFADTIVDVKVDLGNSTGQTEPIPATNPSDACVLECGGAEYIGETTPSEACVLECGGAEYIGVPELLTAPSFVLVKNLDDLNLQSLECTFDNGTENFDKVDAEESIAEFLVCVIKDAEQGDLQENAYCTSMPSESLEKKGDALGALVPVEKIMEFVKGIRGQINSIEITPEILAKMSDGSEKNFSATSVKIEESKGNILDSILRMNKNLLDSVFGDEAQNFPQLKVIPKKAEKPWAALGEWNGKDQAKICYESKNIEWTSLTNEKFVLSGSPAGSITLFESTKEKIPNQNKDGYWDCITIEDKGSTFAAKSDYLEGEGIAFSKFLFDPGQFPNGFIFEVEISNEKGLIAVGSKTAKMGDK